MTQEQKKEITKISKSFASGFKEMFGSINETGWLICDPLSGFLNASGLKNELKQIPPNEHHGQVMVLIF